MSKPTTDDEVLALAEKIKKQRKINAEYVTAHSALKELQRDININLKKITRGTRVSFGTIKPCGYLSKVEVMLPQESADDLIQFCQNYIAEKNV
jgi:hypothetical protein